MLMLVSPASSLPHKDKHKKNHMFAPLALMFMRLFSCPYAYAYALVGLFIGTLVLVTHSTNSYKAFFVFK